MDDFLNILTGLTEQQRKKVLHWVASLPEVETIKIFQDGVKKAYQLKEEHSTLPGKICKYCSFILAARQAGWDTLTGKGYRVAEKEQYEDFSHIRQARAATLINRGRSPILRRKILACWGEVKELKAEGLGFRMIAEYLVKTRKIRTSASYLNKLWREVGS